MSYRNLLLHLDSTPACRQRVNATLDLAERFEAHVTGLVTPAMVMPYAFNSGPSAALIEQSQALIDAQTRQTVTAFEAAAQQYRSVAIESRIASADASAAIALSARYADLVVIGQSNPEQEADEGARVAPGEVLLGCARPVLLIPYIGAPAGFGKTVLIAWNGSRESCRAVADAMPLLKQAQRVIVMAANPQISDAAHGDLPGADLAAYLARHDVKAEAHADPGAEVDIGQELLSRAADLGVDLLVMGAYGHSRAREWVFGGVTRTILQSMTMPVLMSH